MKRPVPCSMPLALMMSGLTRRDGRRDGGQHRAQRLGGNRQNECVSAGKGVGIGCAARPESHRMAGAARHMRQGRTPGARADDAELRLMPWPRACPRHRRATGSGPAASGPRAATARSSVRPKARRSAPAQAIMAALSVQSAAGGTMRSKPWAAAASLEDRLEFLIGGNAARHDQAPGCATSGCAARNSVTRHAQPVGHGLGHGRLEAGADIGDVLSVRGCPARARPRAPRSSVRRRRSCSPCGPSADAGNRSAADCRRAPAVPPAGRRDSRGPGASPPCRRPRPGHRRWWCRGGGSGRRPRRSGTGCGRRRSAAGDRGSRRACSSLARQRVTFEMIDGEQRLVMGQRNGLGGGEADDDAAQQARAGGGRHAIEIRDSAGPLRTWRGRSAGPDGSTWARAAISGTTPP